MSSRRPRADIRCAVLVTTRVILYVLALVEQSKTLRCTALQEASEYLIEPKSKSLSGDHCYRTSPYCLFSVPHAQSSPALSTSAQPKQCSN
ncbi:hypothetical protein PHLGIDRAFT_288174 [Phlebiopsis gigantea 11061_1 CR5-6]|uniref:Uncharacterized protein n=1 Tax=Phlebiopsis gigantea (strain 11061_1 CR5-6) TaxID=745531 RepID=A0A0C3PRN1_PHLG1|nr:hypothetical protein PHLGIDRAFT_288174 [Phlebiopsis gigantea 11061_1 CR5-6]